MAYEMTGTILEVNEFNLKNGKKAREFILSFSNNGYENKIKFQVSEKNFNILSKNIVGTKQKVMFFINGVNTSKGVFNNLNAFRLEPAPDTSNQFVKDDIPF